MKKLMCSLLASFCLAFPLYGSCASLEEIAKPMHESKSDDWEVAFDYHGLTSLVNKKNIQYDKEQNRLSFWKKDVYKEESDKKYNGNVYKFVVDLSKMDIGLEYIDNWDIKKNRISYVSIKSGDKLKFEPLLPGSYSESYVIKALEIAKLPKKIPTPHSYKYIGEGKWPADSSLPRGVKNRTIETYLCTDWYVKDYKKDTWRFYITTVYDDELDNGKTDRYIWESVPVYVNFTAHTIAFREIDKTHKAYEAGYSKAAYNEICELLKSKNDMPADFS